MVAQIICAERFAAFLDNVDEGMGAGLLSLEIAFVAECC